MSHLFYLGRLSKSGKTKVIEVCSQSDDSILGKIVWDGAWRTYIFEPITDYKTKWSNDCLEELKNQIALLIKEHKELKLKQ